jgi:hypothetical protein
MIYAIQKYYFQLFKDLLPQKYVIHIESYERINFCIGLERGVGNRLIRAGWRIRELTDLWEYTKHKHQRHKNVVGQVRLLRKGLGNENESGSREREEHSPWKFYKFNFLQKCYFPNMELGQAIIFIPIWVRLNDYICWSFKTRQKTFEIW